MGKVNNGTYAKAGRVLLAYAQETGIPYVPGGMTLDGMDCQGLCEYLLIQCGVSADACNLKGSNAHYRACVWTGTPEECKKQFGSVPVGAWAFILDTEGGGEIARGYTDGLGDANHMGVYLGDCVIHASSSRGCVAESKFAGRTIPNGGWNRVGLCQWVDYGVTGLSEAAIPVEYDVNEENEEPGEAVVYAENGRPVKLRVRPSAGKTIWRHEVPVGDVVTVLERGKEWSKIRWAGHVGYMMTDFLTFG